MAVEIENAVIKSVGIGKEGFSPLRMCVMVDYGGASQGFGNCWVYSHDKPSSTDFICGLFIYRLLQITGSDSLDEVIGKSIRVKKEGGLIIAIGHFLKDEWFNLVEEIKERQESANERQPKRN